MIIFKFLEKYCKNDETGKSHYFEKDYINKNFGIIKLLKFYYF